MFDCKYALGKIPRGVLLLLSLTLLVVLLLPLIRNLNQFPEIHATGIFETTEETARRSCNIFSGNWVHNPNQLYYDNETCPFIIDKKQSCITAGRPDKEFLKFRWKPRDCELPPFDATQFLELVRGKSMAFVGDSMGRNQIQSLLCLINSVSTPSILLVPFSIFWVYRIIEFNLYHWYLLPFARFVSTITCV